MGLKIIQVGANRGDDEFFRYISLFPSNLIDMLVLVEPFGVHHAALAKQYKHINNKLILGFVVSSRSEEIGNAVSFWYHEADGPYFEVASTKKSHIQKHHVFNPALSRNDGYVELKVQAITINHLLAMLGWTEVDLMCIDAEGCDEQIIQSIDFKKYVIRNLFFETLHLPSCRWRREPAIFSKLRQAPGFAIEAPWSQCPSMAHAFIK